MFGSVIACQLTFEDPKPLFPNPIIDTRKRELWTRAFEPILAKSYGVSYSGSDKTIIIDI